MSESRLVGMVTLGSCDVTLGSIELHIGGGWGDWRVNFVTAPYARAMSGVE